MKKFVTVLLLVAFTLSLCSCEIVESILSSSKKPFKDSLWDNVKGEEVSEDEWKLIFSEESFANLTKTVRKLTSFDSAVTYCQIRYANDIVANSIYDYKNESVTEYYFNENGIDYVIWVDDYYEKKEEEEKKEREEKYKEKSLTPDDRTPLNKKMKIYLDVLGKRETNAAFEHASRIRDSYDKYSYDAEKGCYCVTYKITEGETHGYNSDYAEIAEEVYVKDGKLLRYYRYRPDMVCTVEDTNGTYDVIQNYTDTVFDDYNNTSIELPEKSDILGYEHTLPSSGKTEGGIEKPTESETVTEEEWNNAFSEENFSNLSVERNFKRYSRYSEIDNSDKLYYANGTLLQEIYGDNTKKYWLKHNGEYCTAEISEHDIFVEPISENGYNSDINIMFTDCFGGMYGYYNEFKYVDQLKCYVGLPNEDSDIPTFVYFKDGLVSRIYIHHHRQNEYNDRIFFDYSKTSFEIPDHDYKSLAYAEVILPEDIILTTDKTHYQQFEDEIVFTLEFKKILDLNYTLEYYIAVDGVDEEGNPIWLPIAARIPTTIEGLTVEPMSKYDFVIEDLYYSSTITNESAFKIACKITFNDNVPIHTYKEITVFSQEFTIKETLPVVEDDISVTTDKTEYKNNETIHFTIDVDHPGFDKKIFFPKGYYVEYFEGGKWFMCKNTPALKNVNEGIYMEDVPCKWSLLSYEYTDSGKEKYRIVFPLRLGAVYGEAFTVYSNEFTIKD